MQPVFALLPRLRETDTLWSWLFLMTITAGLTLRPFWITVSDAYSREDRHKKSKAVKQPCFFVSFSNLEPKVRKMLADANKRDILSELLQLPE